MSDYTSQPPEPAGERRWLDASGQNLWIRALFMFMFGVIAYVAIWVVFLLALIQLIVYLVNQSPNRDLRQISQELVGYLSVVLGYLVFARDEKPFPFAPFPRGGES
jgi:uncharacterized membrane protein YeiB